MFYFNSYYYFAALLGMQDLGAWTRDGTLAPAMEVRSLNHWTTGEVPGRFYSSQGKKVSQITY